MGHKSLLKRKKKNKEIINTESKRFEMVSNPRANEIVEQSARERNRRAIRARMKSSSNPRASEIGEQFECERHGRVICASRKWNRLHRMEIVLK